jgi:kumamolisin
VVALPRTADGAPVRMSRSELRQRYGSVPADHELVATVLTSMDPAIQVTGEDAGSRRVTVAGPLGALASAFGAELSLVTSADPATGRAVTHRYRSGGLRVPAQLDGIVVALPGCRRRCAAGVVHPASGRRAV